MGRNDSLGQCCDKTRLDSMDWPDHTKINTANRFHHSGGNCTWNKCSEQTECELNINIIKNQKQWNKFGLKFYITYPSHKNVLNKPLIYKTTNPQNQSKDLMIEAVYLMLEKPVHSRIIPICQKLPILWKFNFKPRIYTPIYFFRIVIVNNVFWQYLV